MLAQTLQQPVIRTGLRPYNPFRDTDAVADVIESAFGDELALTGNEVVGEMRRWARWWPLLWLLNPVDPLSVGFVWLEEGRIVGNINLWLTDARAGHWLITNVAVLPEYRRRGIGQQLVAAGLDLIRAREGKVALLQVRQDNPAAIALYARFGFRPYHTVVEMRREASDWPAHATSHWQPVSWRDQPAADELYRAAIPAIARYYRANPQAPYPFRRSSGPDRWLDDLLARRRIFQQAVKADARLLAMVQVVAQRPPRPHHLAFLVHPQARDEYARDTVQQGLSLLRGQPLGAVLSTVTAGGAEEQALAFWGFAPVRRLEQMKLDLAE